MALTKATYSMIGGAPVNVLDYGAVGDGVADDTSAIQAAITAAGTTKALVWPTGTYLVTSQLTNTGYWYAQGTVTIKFSGLGATTDCLLITGGASYLPTVTDGFIVDCQATGRDGVVLMNGDHPTVRIKVKNAQRDGFAVFCGGFDWVENADMDIFTESNGRHGCRFEVWGSDGAFFNESIISLEVRGVSRRYNDGYGLWGFCPASAAGSKISAIHFPRINLDAQRGAAVAAGFDIGENPVYLTYAPGGQNTFEAWEINGGGFETTSGTADYRSPYLIYAEADINAAYWDVRGIVPYNWSSGDNVYGLVNYTFHSCKTPGPFFTSNVVASSALFPTFGGGVTANIDIPIPEFPAAANYGATFSSIVYDLTLCCQQYNGSGYQEFHIRRVEISNNLIGSGVNWLSSIVVASNIGTGIATVNSLAISGNNLRVNITTGAGFGGGGGDNHIFASLTRVALVRV